MRRFTIALLVGLSAAVLPVTTCWASIDWAVGSIQNGASGGTTDIASVAHPWAETDWQPEVRNEAFSRIVGSRWWVTQPGESVSIGGGAASGWAFGEVDPQTATIKVRAGAMNYGGPAYSSMPGIGLLPGPAIWGTSGASAGAHQYFEAGPSGQPGGTTSSAVTATLNVHGDLEAGDYRHAGYGAAVLVTRILDEDLFFDNYTPTTWSQLMDMMGTGVETWYANQWFGPQYDVPASEVLAHVGLIHVGAGTDPGDSPLDIDLSQDLAFTAEIGDRILVETFLHGWADMDNTVHAAVSDIRDVFAHFDQTAGSELTVQEPSIALAPRSIPGVPEPASLSLLALAGLAVLRRRRG